MTRWIIAATLAVLAAVLALAALSTYILSATDACVYPISTVRVTRIPNDTAKGVDADATLSPRQIASVADDAGFTGEDLPIAVAVALAESGGRPTAINVANGDGSSDHGLWQINSIHRASGFDPARAYDPTYNAAWARRVFIDAGHRWTPWVAYTTGAHRRHLISAKQAATDVDPQPVRLTAGDLDLAAVCAPTTPADLGSAAGKAGAITAAELAAIGTEIGQHVPAYSVLRDSDPYGDGTGGPSVNLLAPQMKVAVARLEIAMHARLQVTSGYRTADYQAQLCARPGIGRCAAPGTSMHQHGLAVDVVNWRQTLPHLDAVDLCQPLPSDDAVHLSHVDGTEC